MFPFSSNMLIHVLIYSYTHTFAYPQCTPHCISWTQNGVPDDNVPGLMLKGLGTQAIVDEHNNGKSFKRSNDTIRDNLGIWYG